MLLNLETVLYIQLEYYISHVKRPLTYDLLCALNIMRVHSQKQSTAALIKVFMYRKNIIIETNNIGWTS